MTVEEIFKFVEKIKQRILFFVFIAGAQEHKSNHKQYGCDVQYK
jgi:hypothetical protein